MRMLKLNIKKLQEKQNQYHRIMIFFSNKVIEAQI
jgi:ribosomal protein L18